MRHVPHPIGHDSGKSVMGVSDHGETVPIKDYDSSGPDEEAHVVSGFVAWRCVEAVVPVCVFT